MFLPALVKLKNFLSFVEREQVQLCRQTSAEDQAALLRQEPISQNKGICNLGILN